jgi:hypothetical protein
VPGNEVIVREGDSADRFYVIVSGDVQPSTAPRCGSALLASASAALERDRHTVRVATSAERIGRRSFEPDRAATLFGTPASDSADEEFGACDPSLC